MKQEIEKLIRYVLKDKQEIFQQEFLEIMEKKQNQDFMNGYKYAIKVLEEGLIKREE